MKSASKSNGRIALSFLSAISANLTACGQELAPASNVKIGPINYATKEFKKDSVTLKSLLDSIESQPKTSIISHVL